MGDKLDPSSNGDNTILPNDGMDSVLGDLSLESESSPESYKASAKRRTPAIRYIGFGLLGLGIIVAAFLLLQKTPNNKSANARLSASVNQRFGVQSIPSTSLNTLSNNTTAISSSPTLSVNGKLQANSSLIVTPSSQPTDAVAGEVYYNKLTNELGYYNGSSFDYLGNIPASVTSLGGASGAISVGIGLNQNNNQLTNSGVLSLQGQRGNISFVSGAGISVSGVQFTNTGVLALGGETGSINLGNGLSVSNGTLENSGVVSITSGSGNISVTNDGNGNITISSNGAGTGNVSSAGGTPGVIAVFSGSNDVENSLLSESGSTVSLTGTLNAGSFIGNGASVTNVNAVTLQGDAASYFTNASNISTGTLNDARLNSDVALLDATTSNFTGTNLEHNGNAVCDASNNCGYLTGASASGSYIQLQGSTPGTAQTGNFNISGTGIAGTLSATTLVGNGASVTNVNAVTLQGDAASYFTNASNISTGTLNDARLNSDVALLDATTSNFTGTNLEHNGNAVCDASNNCGYLTGASASGSYIQLQGSTPGTAQTGNFNISGTGIAGTLSATTLVGNGASVTNVNAVTLQGDAASYFTNASNISTGTLNDARLNSDVALLDATTSNFTGTNLEHNGNAVCDASNNCGYLTGASASGSYIQLQGSTPGTAQTGNFNISGTGIAGTLSATTLVGNGASVTNVNAVTLQGDAASYFTNASNISTGTLNDARLNSDVALLDATTSNFTGTNLEHNGNAVCDASNNCGYLTGASASGSYIQLQGSTPGTAQTGNFNISGTGIAGTLSATTLVGNGASVTNVNAVTLQGDAASYFTNASNISTGTLNDARLNSDVALLDATTSNFTGTNLEHNGNAVCDASNNCGYLTGASASGSYIQLQGSTPGTAQTGNFNISGTGISGTLLVSTSGALDTASSGVLSVGTTVATGVSLGSTTETGTITLGQSSGSNTINIGDANTASGKTQTVNIGNGSDAGSGDAVVTIGNTNGASSTLIQGGSSGTTISDTTGNLTLQGNGGTVLIGGTAPTITTSSSGLAVDTGGAATLSLGDVNATSINIGSSSNAATAITIGKNGETSTLSLKAGGGTANISEDGATSNTINLSNSNFSANSKTYSINIGNVASTANTGDVVNTTIGPSAALTGGTVGGSTILQAQGLSDTITASATNPTDIIQTVDNSTGAFQIQDAAGGTVLNEDTTANTLTSTGNLNVAQAAAPTVGSFTATPVAGSGLVTGTTYYYAVTYVTASGQTSQGAIIGASTVTTGTNDQMSLTNIPVSASALVTARKIYRTKSTNSSTAGPFYLVATIANNTTTTYTDSTADASLGTAAAPTINQSSTFDEDGTQILNVSTNADNNEFFGVLSGSSLSGSITSAIDNTGVGYASLQGETTAAYNTAIGFESLQNTTSGSYNTALGMGTALNNSTGTNNTAIGYQALSANTTGIDNIALGSYALNSLTATSNTASYNTAVGYGALQGDNDGIQDTSIGFDAGYNFGGGSTSGNNDTAIGYEAGYNDGSFSTLGTVANSTAIGYEAQVQSSDSIVLGGEGANQVNVGIGTTSPTNTLSVSPYSSTYSTGTAGTGGVFSVTVTGSGTNWTSAMVGDEIIFADGTKRTISAVSSTTSLTITSAVTESSGQNFRVQIPALQVTSGGNVGIGTITPAANLQVVTQQNNTAGFEVQNAAQNNVFTVDTSDNSNQGEIILGKASANTGTIVFNNSANANTITLSSGTTSASYSLTLPTSAPTINQCLLSGSSTASQLVFGACNGSSSTSLQQAYNNSAGATPSIDIQGSGGTNYGGITIQNDFTHPITSGNLFAINNGASSGLGASLFSVQSTGDTSITSSDTSGNALSLTANAITNGNGLIGSFNGLTSGDGVNLSTTSAIQSGSGSVLNVSDTAQLLTNGATVTGSLLNVNRALTSAVSGGSSSTATYDGNALAVENTSISSTWTNSFTVTTNSNLYLFVAIYSLDNSWDNCQQPGGVTYNGTSMGSPFEVDSTNCIYYYGLINPSSGSAHNLVVTDSGGARADMVVDSFYNVSQTTPYANSSFTEVVGSTSNPSITIPTSSHQVAVDAMFADSFSAGSSLAVTGSSQTKTALLGTGTGPYGDSEDNATSYATVSGSTVTMGWNTPAGGYITNIYTGIALNGYTTTATETVSAPVASISNSCLITTGACTDATNVLSLSQQYSSATGAVLGIQNSGSGFGLQIQNGSSATALTVTTSNLTGIDSTTTATAAVLTLGKITGGDSIAAYGAVASSLGDYAEYFNQATPGQLQPGDVTCLNASGTVEDCNTSNSDDTLAGVVSTNPGFIGNNQIYNTSDPANTALVSMLGQVPVKVSTANGNINVGDTLTMSNTSGIAVKATGPGEAIGTALEAYSGTGTGEIQVYIHVNYYAPSLTETLQNGSQAGYVQNGDSVSFSALNVSGETTLQDLAVTGEATIGTLTVTGNLTTNTLTVNGHIVTAGSTPTILNDLQACTDAVVTVNGTDTAGLIALTTSSACSVTTNLVNIVFSNAYTKNPNISITSANADAATLQTYIDSSNTSTTGFTISTNANSLKSSTTYSWYYQVIQ